MTEPLLRPMTGHDPLAGCCAYLLWLGRMGGDGWRTPAEATLRFMLGVMLSGPLTVEPSAELPNPLASAVAFVP